MPEMDGYEVCRRLRAKDRSRDVPVIFLTALTDTADKVRAFETGGVDYVTKPFQFEEVLARVKTHVALRRAQVGAGRQLHASSGPGAAAGRPGAHGRPRHAVAAGCAAASTSSFLKGPAATLSEDEPRGPAGSGRSRPKRSVGWPNDLLDVSRLEEGRCRSSGRCGI